MSRAIASACQRGYWIFWTQAVHPRLVQRFLNKHGILISVPAPARFAFHKLVVSQRRRSGDAEKIKRDLSQAEQLFEILVEGRPGYLILAHEAAEKMGEKFMRQLVAGMKLIEPEVSEAIGEYTGSR